MRRRNASVPILAAILMAMPAASPCAARDVAGVPAARAGVPCPGHGAGFVRLAGGATCARVSGRVAAGADLRAGPAATPAASGRLAIDTRTESEFGLIRTFVRIGDGRR